MRFARFHRAWADFFFGEFEIEYLALAQRAMGQVGNEGLGEQKPADRAASGLYS